MKQYLKRLKEESCRHTPPLCTLILSISLTLFVAISFSDSPPANTIPIIADRPTFEDITLELLCTLSWMHFDAVNRYGYNPPELLEKLVEPAADVGLYVIISPGLIWQWDNQWARMSIYPIDHDNAYARPGWYDPAISSCSGDTLLESKTASEMQSSLETAVGILAGYFEDQDNVWFYLCFDEAPARQWNRMVNDSAEVNESTYVACFFDDYIPNMFTQAMDSVYRSDYQTPGNYWLPTLEEVEPTGMVSWLKWELEDAESYHPMTITFSGMHTMVDWAGASNLFEETGFNPPSYSDQATAVRSFLNMEYQDYSDSILDAEENFPEFFAVDAYPFRIVGIEYQEAEGYTPALGDSLELWIFEQYIEAIDSTFIPAREIAIERGTDIPIIYWPQGFGRVGGNAMWAYDDTLSQYILDYKSCFYRYPTPQEFLMNCNIALLRGAKGIQPFCLASYDQGTYSVLAGHLDRNHVPFDAPYEEWVYRDRPISDTLQYISPDLIPPFMDGYDPLYDLPSRPVAIPYSERNVENYLLWKFEPYGRLWNSMQKTFAQIARVAPELATLWWWEDYENEASIEYDGTEPDPFYAPRIKVFTDSTESDCYLFYVNRYCRANDNPFEIVYDSSDLPGGIDHSDRVLDHSRRFVMDGVQNPRGVYTFLDTLDAGQARLVQLFNADSGLAADIRITSPDVWTIKPYTDDTTSVLRNTHGETLDIIARFYNMGTERADNVEVTAFDLTDEAFVGSTDYLDFDGLSTDSGSCRQTDSDDVIFSWNTGSASIGPHIIRIRAEGVQSEPDTLDNTVLVTFLLDPVDYATEVLENAWDMNEDGDSTWHTDDITDLDGWVSSSFSDSVSGMFEGAISNPGSTDRLFLNTGSGASNYIDTDTYHNLSLAAKAQHTLDMYLYWIDTDNVTHYVDTGEDLTTNWAEIGPIDLEGLSLSWAAKRAKQVWLEFSGSNLETEVRIGWIRLTE